MQNYKIGVMQGRLLPKYNGRYQAHPIGYWKDEFEIAKKYNLYSIEFILDYEMYNLNPLMTKDGIDQIKKCIDQYEVNVKTICADYFMEMPFYSNIKKIVKQNNEVIKTLIINAKDLNIKDIVIPCVDNSSLKTENHIISFIENIKYSINLAEKYDINLSLETDLKPKIFSQLLTELSSQKITVNYDTGNSASLGYYIQEEFKYYGDKISDIHIKDRKLNSNSVILGEGDVDFNYFFKLLKSINYNSALIMQAYRDDEGLMIFEKQLEFIKEKLKI